MDDFKINTNPPKVSDEQAMKHMSFDKVMASYQAMKLPFYKTLRFWLWTTGGFTALVALIVLLNINLSPKAQTGTPVIPEPKDTLVAKESEPEPIVEEQITQQVDTVKIITTKAEITTKEDTISKRYFVVNQANTDTSNIELEKVVTAKEIAKPVVSVCGKGNGETIDKMQLGTVGKLKAEIREIREKLTVESFDMEYTYKGKPKILHSDSYKLSKSMLYATDDMQAGDTVRFYNIRASYGKKTYQLDDLKVIISDGIKQW